MTAKFFAPILLAGATAAAVALAPVAVADMRCDNRSLNTTLCQKSGHASISTSPDSIATGSAFNPFGAGPMPPIWAFD
jgi:NaMN:DMB phosphoribosyltransferase